MQKLVKRVQPGFFASSSVVSSLSSASSPTLSIPRRSCKSPLSSIEANKVILNPPMAPSLAATVCGNGVYRSLLLEKSMRRNVRNRFTSLSCSCVGDNRNTSPSFRPFRAWVVARPAWFCSGSSGAEATNLAAAAAAAMDGLHGTQEEENDDINSKKVAKGSPINRFSKRVKSSGEINGNYDLLTIPGVGPKNLQKLLGKGLCGMAELKQLYKDKFLGESKDKMVEYLQTSVGIIHRNHAESITIFIKESVDEELKDTRVDKKGPSNKRITFCVEGNISVGKTTFLQKIVSDTIELRDLVEVVPEPIDKWQDIGPDHFNILNAFYAEPQRYAYTFQNYVFVTRVMQERESSGGLKPLRLMERSVFSDRMVFVRAVHEARWMNEMEISIYDSWFDPVVSVLPGLIPDGFIYLRASPDTCHKRMKHRRRTEEGGVSLDYLRDLHEKHESWLFPFESGNHGVLSVTKPQIMDTVLHPDIRGKVFYLEGDHMHSSIQKVPALVLDCEANIDLNRDIEAKQHYARQVSEFFKFVTSRKDESVPQSGKNGVEGRKIVLPNQGGLLLPDGSIDFRKALTSFTSQ